PAERPLPPRRHAGGRNRRGREPARPPGPPDHRRRGGDALGRRQAVRPSERHLHAGSLILGPTLLFVPSGVPEAEPDHPTIGPRRPPRSRRRPTPAVKSVYESCPFRPLSDAGALAAQRRTRLPPRALHRSSTWIDKAEEKRARVAGEIAWSAAPVHPR